MPQDIETNGSAPEPRRRVTMHDDVETWVDTCSCEPEPRWQALAEELEAEEQARSTGSPASEES